MKYRVELIMDSTYQVVERFNNSEFDEVLFQGSLADCEAYIKLNEQGYM